MSAFDSVEKVDPDVVADANAGLARQVLAAMDFKLEERVIKYIGYEDVLTISVGGEIIKEVVIKRTDFN